MVTDFHDYDLGIFLLTPSVILKNWYTCKQSTNTSGHRSKKDWPILLHTLRLSLSECLHRHYWILWYGRFGFFCGSP